MMRSPAISCCLLIIVATAAPARAQTVAQNASLAAARRASVAAVRRTVTAGRIAQPIRVDGRQDESLWQSADVADEFVAYEPVAGGPARHPTEARVLYDESAIYVAMRAYDTSPDSIVGKLARRDDSPFSDWLIVALDSYYDRRTAFVFGLNPAGARMDEMIYDDGPENLSWDPIWEGAATVDSLGWTAEFRIPLSQLRYSAPVDGSAQLWGVQFHRKVARSNETSFWAPMEREANGIVSFFGELHGIAGLRPGRNLEVMPYTVGQVTRAPRPDGADPFYRASALRGSMGADFKYGLTSNLTVSGTINPDFGQVEADPSVVNLSAYETFLSEKRPFFVEGADIFNFGIGIGDGDLGNESLFYSRRIGRQPQGSEPDDAEYTDAPNATTILGAAKLSGKTASGWSLGLLNALTAREQADYELEDGTRERAVVEPATYYTVGRLGRDFHDGRTAVGGIFTATNRQLAETELAFLRSAAYTGGLNARHRWGGGNYEVSGWVVGSHVRGDTAAIGRTQRSPARYFQRPDNEHTSYDPLRTSLSGWAANVQAGKWGGNWRYATILNVKSPGFEANDLGFQQSADQVFQVWFLGYSRNQPTGILNRFNFNTNQWNAWDFGGRRTSFGGNINGNVQFRNYWGFNAGLNHDFEVWSTGALRGGPAIRNPARSNLWTYSYSDSRKPVSAGLGAGFNREHGTDGGSWWLEPSLNVRAGSRASFSLGPSLSRNRSAGQYVTQEELGADGPAGDQYVFARMDQTTVAMTARASYTFTPMLSLQFYAQPFVSAGRYSRFMRVQAPGARRYQDRFEHLDDAQLAYDGADERYRVDVDRNGTPEFDFDDPDFNFKELRSNAVLRWEYRPGSTLFLVWSQGRSQGDDHGDFRLGRDASDLLGAQSTNVLLVKLSYWLGL